MFCSSWCGLIWRLIHGWRSRLWRQLSWARTQASLSLSLRIPPHLSVSSAPNAGPPPNFSPLRASVRHAIGKQASPGRAAAGAGGSGASPGPARPVGRALPVRALRVLAPAPAPASAGGAAALVLVACALADPAHAMSSSNNKPPRCIMTGWVGAMWANTEPFSARGCLPRMLLPSKSITACEVLSVPRQVIHAAKVMFETYTTLLSGRFMAKRRVRDIMMAAAAGVTRRGARALLSRVRRARPAAGSPAPRQSNPAMSIPYHQLTRALFVGASHCCCSQEHLPRPLKIK